MWCLWRDNTRGMGIIYGEIVTRKIVYYLCRYYEGSCDI